MTAWAYFFLLERFFTSNTISFIKCLFKCCRLIILQRLKRRLIPNLIIQTHSIQTLHWFSHAHLSVLTFRWCNIVLRQSSWCKRTWNRRSLERFQDLLVNGLCFLEDINFVDGSFSFYFFVYLYLLVNQLFDLVLEASIFH